MAYDLPEIRLARPLMLEFSFWSDLFTLHTKSSVAVARAVLTKVVQDMKEFIIAFVRRRSSKTHANRVPTKRECIAVLYAVTNFRQYRAGR